MNSRIHPFSLERIRHILHRFEDGILVGLLVLMISVAVLQIFLRNVFETAIIWGDALVRILVLWIALAGAMVASREDNHISIDIVSRYLPQKFRLAASTITSLFTALICGIVAWYSLKFVMMEMEDGGMAFARVPAWICESIIPFSFSVIGMRYVILSIINIINLFKASS